MIGRVNPGDSIQVRTAVFSTTNAGTTAAGVNTMRRYELSYAKAFGENLTLRIGYADWTIRGYADTSEFHLHSAGPALVLDWDFNGSPSGRHEQSDSQPLAEPRTNERISTSQILSVPKPLVQSNTNEGISKRQEQSPSEPREQMHASTPVAPALATQGGGYVTVGVGMVHFANAPVSSNPQGSLVRIDNGYDFNSYAGVEIGYSVGKATDTYNGGFYNETNTLKYSAVHVAAVATYPFTDKFGVFAKLGMAHTSLESTHSSTYNAGSGNGNRTNAMFGLGWKLNISKHFGVRVQYENFGKIPLTVSYQNQPYDVGVQVFSAGGVYNF